MGWFDFAKVSTGDDTDVRDSLAQYQRLRPIRLQLNDELASRLSRDVIDEGAKRIGILRGGKLYFETEDQCAVLMDYCIYDVHRSGRNAIDDYLTDKSPEPDSDQAVCLRAMQHAKYTILVVNRVVPGIGCRVRDLFTDEERLLVDLGFSRSAVPGGALMTRVLDFGDHIATGGAALPLGVLNDELLDQWQQRIGGGLDDVPNFDPGPLIRASLRSGASRNIRYEAGGPGRVPRPQPRPQGRAPDVSAANSVVNAKPRPSGARPRFDQATKNRRCRCGSGKLIKNCCGKNRGR